MLVDKKMKKYTLLSMRNDDKAENLNAAGQKYSFSINSSPYRWNALFPIFLLCEIILMRKPEAVIVRYLNDSSSLFRSIILMLSMLLTLFISKIMGIKLFWFLHNVDKESSEHFPKLIKIQRKLVGDLSMVIFVMDHLLVAAAKEKYPLWKNKIDYISFGLREGEGGTKTDEAFFNNDLVNFLTKKSKKKLLVGFCPTAASDKCLHLNYAKKFIDAAKVENIEVRLVIFGELSIFLQKNPELKEQLTDKQIYLYDKFVDYNPSDFRQYINFYWRSLSDESISYTLYEAATAGKPTVTLDFGFVGRAVEYYKLGVVLRSDMSNINVVFNELSHWKHQTAEKFLETHSWDNAARRISKYL